MNSVKKKFSNKHIAIAYRPESPEALNKAKEISNWLHEVKVNVYSSSGKKLGKHVKALETNAQFEKLNLIIQ